MKKIIAALAIAAAVFIIFKTVKIYPTYKKEKMHYLAVKNRESDLKSQILAMQRVKIPKAIYGYHRLSTYLFTFFSYINYLNRNGYKCKISLKKAFVLPPNTNGNGKPGIIPAFHPAGSAPIKLATMGKTAQANFGQIKNISYFIGKSNTFYGLDKTEVRLTINKYYSIKDILAVINNIENLFPSKIGSIKISKKEIKITFNLYGV